MTERDKGTTQTITPSESQTKRRDPSPKERTWEENTLRPTLENNPERQAEFTTISGHPIRRLYTPADLRDWDPGRSLGLPGEPPYTLSLIHI